MNIIVVKTQAEWDALPKAFDVETRIEIRSDANVWLSISKAPESSHVVARESSHVVAWESSHVVAWGSSHVEAWGSSHVEAWGSSHVVAWESSHVVAWESSHVVARESSHVVARGSSHVVARESSHVVAWGSSHVVAWESSHVVARESSHVVAWGSSHVEAWGSSHVVAWESSHVVAWESSHVVARESSHVEAWGSSHVEAWGSSHVVAWESSHVVARESSHVVARGSSHVVARGSVSVHVQSDLPTVDLFGFAVAILVVAAKKVSKKSKTATIVRPKTPKGTRGWLEANAIKPAKKVIVYKRVSSDWKTQENTANETAWPPGATLEHAKWNPTKEECGGGKFHACGRPYFCDEFRSTAGDRYIAIEVAAVDLHAWDDRPDYPHKIAFRKGTVLYEVDRFGKRIGGKP